MQFQALSNKFFFVKTELKIFNFCDNGTIFIFLFLVEGILIAVLSVNEPFS